MSQKPKLLMLGIASSSLAFLTLNAQAQDTPAVEQLLQTNACENCDLSQQDLTSLNLSGANLENANLSGSDLQGTNLQGSNLVGADLRNTNLKSVTLRLADLQNSNLTGAALYRNSFYHSNLDGANLAALDLSWSNFASASLRNANLENANLSKTDLTKADLTSANLRGSDLSGAKLYQAVLDNVNLSATNLSKTIMPDGTINADALQPQQNMRSQVRTNTKVKGQQLIARQNTSLPSNKSLLTELKTAAREGNTQRAIELLNQAKRLGLDTPAVYNNLAIFFSRKRKLRIAFDVLQDAIKRYPDNNSLLNNFEAARDNLIQSLIAKGDSESVADLTQSGDISDSLVLNDLYRQANAAQSNSNWPKAESLWRQILQLKPTDALVLNNLSVALSEQDAHQEAIELSESALRYASGKNQRQIAANAANAHTAFCSSKHRFDDEDELLGCYGTIATESLIANHQIANVFASRQRYPEALKFFQKGFQLVLSQEAQVRESNICRQSIQRRLEYQNFCQDFATLFNNWGLYLQDKGDPKSAINKFQASLEVNPYDAKPYAHISVALREQGLWKQALDSADKALGLDSGNVVARHSKTEINKALAGTVVDDSAANSKKPEESDFNLSISKRAVVYIENSEGSFGSGWVIKKKKGKLLIATNCHVVMASERCSSMSQQSKRRMKMPQVYVRFYSESGIYDRESIEATILHYGSDGMEGNDIDLAILEVDDVAPDVIPLEFYQQVIGAPTNITAIGHPVRGGTKSAQYQDTRWSVSVGNISVSRQNLLTIDANLASGNSGGPVLDTQNRVLGIIFEATSPNALTATQGVGRAYPAQLVIEQLNKWGIVL